MTSQCQYCQKEFQRERSLEVHMCEPKRRYSEQNERGVQLGYQAFLKFYQTTQGSNRLKNFDDFATSNYYKAFVKFGRYCVNVRVIAPEQFLSYLLKHNKKIDHWCKDSLYEEYLLEYLKQEPMTEALDRAVKEMQTYAENSSGLANWADYFRFGNSNRICHHITTGRISPWVCYCCDSGIEFLDRIDPSLLAIIFPYIDPNFWNRKLQDYIADAEWCREILKKAGL
jgi:hypothetical protein